jgi:hypothetical protein
MKKQEKQNWCKNKIQQTKMMKRCLVVALGIVLVATVVISFYPASQLRLLHKL